jgi:hypothetical protein
MARKDNTPEQTIGMLREAEVRLRPPAPEAILPPAQGLPYAPLRSVPRLAKPAGL